MRLKLTGGIGRRSEIGHEDHLPVLELGRAGGLYTSVKTLIVVLQPLKVC
jgi:hypothetical protein